MSNHKYTSKKKLKLIINNVHRGKINFLKNFFSNSRIKMCIEQLMTINFFSKSISKNGSKFMVKLHFF